MASVLDTVFEEDEKEPGAPISLSHLATVTNRDEASVAKVIRRFEARGWVKVVGRSGSPREVPSVVLQAEGRRARRVSRRWRRIGFWLSIPGGLGILWVYVTFPTIALWTIAFLILAGLLLSIRQNRRRA